jgi:hypothetical protein
MAYDTMKTLFTQSQHTCTQDSGQINKDQQSIFMINHEHQRSHTQPTQKRQQHMRREMT